VRQKNLHFSPEHRESTRVTLCCRNCDREREMTRLDAISLGWTDLIRMNENRDSWAWFEFLGVCDKCNADPWY